MASQEVQKRQVSHFARPAGAVRVQGPMRALSSFLATPVLPDGQEELWAALTRFASRRHLYRMKPLGLRRGLPL